MMKQGSTKRRDNRRKEQGMTNKHGAHDQSRHDQTQLVLAAVKSLAADVANVRTGMTKLEASLRSSSKNDLTELRTALSGELKAVEDRLNAKIDGVEAKIDGVEAKMVGVEAKIGNLEGSVAQMGHQLSAIGDDVDRLRTRVSNIESFPHLPLSQPPNVFGTVAQSVSNPKRVRAGYAG
jgi:septal ring factor EnvC (AmiA/AmiB activator)